MTIVRFHNHVPVSFYPGNTLKYCGRFHHLPGFEDDYSPVDSPSANISESDTQWTIRLAAPGYDKSELKVETEKNILRISAERKNDETIDQEYSRREFRYGDFCKNFRIPETVNTDGVRAEYENGILTVHLPKKDENITKPPRRIGIA